MSADQIPTADPGAKANKEPPGWVKKWLPWVFVLGALIVWWSPTGAPRDAPSRPCPELSAEEFTALLSAGATRGTVTVAADGTSDAVFGPGVVSCSSGSTAGLQVCKRTTDLVIEYLPDDGAPFFVRVPEGVEYRFRSQSAPNTCELLVE